MIIKGNRQNGQPVLIKNNIVSSSERIPLYTNEFSESWIQKIIHENAAILPISDIESGFAPAISIGREVKTNAGFIDNLLISAEGYITIVETKLWRNPQARREVVGQILDYAKELSKWTFTDLDDAVRHVNQNSEGLISMIRNQAGNAETDEHTLIDNISRNLKRGRFLLLIVGDGIRESVEEMVEYLSQSPQLHFTLALVELQVYKLSGEVDSLLIIPQIITRTREITRAIVRIEGDYATGLKVNIDTDLGVEPVQTQKQSYGRTTLTAQDYFEQLGQNTDQSIVDFVKKMIADSEQIGLLIAWNTGSLGLQFPDPSGSGINLSILTVNKRGQIQLGYAEKQLIALNIPLAINYTFCADTAQMFAGIEPNKAKMGSWNKNSTILDLITQYDRFMLRIEKYLEEVEMM
ncbi:hypothetical protein [Dyadobacter psychrotolerans]|jgi:hypothetical protein|uniref:DUF91 domain-containing protein n=1 Tax=Dyadobacter psychrotolerans TaxID=2541721 RepID=A0A4R5DAB7_9BACT|nr:hypothetical protein [Dyadobacter psychrotolerans]TDE09767.1 hypothetical protein E0F88_29695 [Dyadobacter psychrotolerans]